MNKPKNSIKISSMFASGTMKKKGFVDRRSLEKGMVNVHRLLEGRDFGSVEEANEFLQKALASREPIVLPSRTALEQAQDMMYDAWAAAGKRRVELAKRALEISRDCADAYVLLAEETTATPEQARNLYEQGVMAGERALGDAFFKENAGRFWKILKTRPYLRARAGFAQSLWILGEHKKAIDHYRDMLRLNPGDNQGIRYRLVNCLFEEGDDRSAKEIIEQYADDISAAWLYSKALLKFRREGRNPKVDNKLRRVLDFNPFVPIYLLGAKKLPKCLPEFYGLGDEDEAVIYVLEAASGWMKTPGAMEWLAAVVQGKV